MTTTSSSIYIDEKKCPQVGHPEIHTTAFYGNGKLTWRQGDKIASVMTEKVNPKSKGK